jgi:hypothetical protein
MQLEAGELSGWVRAFGLTQLVEVPIYFVALGSVRLNPGLAAKRSPGMRLGVAFLCSLLTHPIVWFVFPRLINIYTHYLAMVVAAETFAVLVEAAVLARFGLHKAFWVSLLANMSSLWCGFLLRYLVDWF